MSTGAAIPFLPGATAAQMVRSLGAANMPARYKAAAGGFCQGLTELEVLHERKRKKEEVFIVDVFVGRFTRQKNHRKVDYVQVTWGGAQAESSETVSSMRQQLGK